jgi:hypothetical protein
MKFETAVIISPVANYHLFMHKFFGFYSIFGHDFQKVKPFRQVTDIDGNLGIMEVPDFRALEDFPGNIKNINLLNVRGSGVNKKGISGGVGIYPEI